MRQLSFRKTQNNLSLKMAGDGRPAAPGFAVLLSFTQMRAGTIQTFPLPGNNFVTIVLSVCRGTRM